MRSDTLLLLLTTSLFSGVAQAAADKPVIGPPPAWVKPVAVPPAPAKPDEAPVRLLLADQQARLEPGLQTLYSDMALSIQTPQGLAAGNLSLPWDPDRQTLTVHKLVIHRGGTDIDVLASGQTFTVVRREPNLESATLDGVLTANIQPQGLQVGDVLEFAVSMTTSDPVLKGHVEQIGAVWNSLPISHAHFSAQWPGNVPLTLRQSGELPVLKPVKAGGMTKVDLSLDNVAPIMPPKYAPSRYAMGRIVELSDFKSWAELGALMAPLYQQAAIVPAQGPLRDALEAIRTASTDPVTRAQAALALVQDKLRYVALLMGAGGYVPASAQETWSRRFGDCKAKTALLLALLHELGIAADPVLVSTRLGDGLDQRLPMIGLFDHVIVRATIAGKTYWLDGTRTGDTSLARLRVPEFGWGLPLVAKDAALVRMLPPPLDRPDEELAIHIDAHDGLSLPAPFRAETILRGDGAIGIRLRLASVTADARDRFLRDYWKGQFSFLDVDKTEDSFDPATGEEHLTVTGMAHMEWKNGWYETDKTSLGYKADFARTPGAQQDAPFANDYPSYSRTVETILLPPGFPQEKDIAGAVVDETIAGTAYHRHAQIVDNMFTIEATSRAIAPEFPAKDAPAAEKALKALADKTVYIRMPEHYRWTDAELAAALKSTPKSAGAFLARGSALLDRQKFKEALGDFDQALALEPSDADTLTNRGIARAWLGQFDDAAKDLDAAAAIDPRNEFIFHGRGIIAAAKGDLPGAIKAYSEAIALDPNDLFAISQRAQASYAKGDYAAVLADDAALLRIDPHQPGVYLQRASVLRLQGKHSEAMAEAAALEAANPDQEVTFVAAARIYASLGETDEAVKAFDRALAIKPNPLVYVARASIRPRADMAGREADFDAALKLSPGDFNAISGKAAMLVDKGDMAGAIKLYTAGLAKYIGEVRLLAGRGVAYAKAGDAVHAKADFAAAREFAATPDALNNLCWVKATAGVALETALSDCDAALAKLPNSPAILDSRAFVLLRLGRVDDAIAGYNKALAKVPTLPASLFGRAVAWSRKGDKAKSDADLAAALKVDPTVQKTFAGYGVTLDARAGTSAPAP